MALRALQLACVLCAIATASGRTLGESSRSLLQANFNTMVPDGFYSTAAGNSYNSCSGSIDPSQCSGTRYYSNVTTQAAMVQTCANFCSNCSACVAFTVYIESTTVQGRWWGCSLSNRANPTPMSGRAYFCFVKDGIVVPSPPPPPAPVSSGMVFSTQDSTGGSCPPYVSNYGSSQTCMVALEAGQRINFGTTVVQGSACQGLTSISLRDGRQTYVTSLSYNKGNCSYSSWTVQTKGNYQIQETCVFADQPCGGTVAFTFGTPSPPPPPSPLPPPAVFTSTRVRIGHDHFENMLMGIGHNNPHPRNGGATSTSTETTADGYKNTYVTSTTTEAAVVRTGTGHEKSKLVTSTTTDVQHPVTRTFYNSPPPPPSPPAPPSPPPPAFVASAALTNGACQSDNTGDKTYRTCWPSAGSAGGVTQSWTSGLPKKTTTVTLARNMAWTSSTATSAGGFYTLSAGDGSCGAGGAPRGGRLYLSCAPATSLKVLEPSTCYYNITYSMPTACAGSVPVGTFTTPSGLCLGAAAGSAAGTLVQLQPCAAASGAQAWSLIPSSSPGFSALFNAATGLCLDVSGGYTTNGTKLQLYTCNGSPAQQWSNPAATPAAMTSGMGTRICAAAAGAAGAQAVTQNPCATATQQWRFTPSA